MKTARFLLVAGILLVFSITITTFAHARGCYVPPKSESFIANAINWGNVCDNPDRVCSPLIEDHCCWILDPVTHQPKYRSARICFLAENYTEYQCGDCVYRSEGVSNLACGAEMMCREYDHPTTPPRWAICELTGENYPCVCIFSYEELMAEWAAEGDLTTGYIRYECKCSGTPPDCTETATWPWD